MTYDLMTRHIAKSLLDFQLPTFEQVLPVLDAARGSHERKSRLAIWELVVSCLVNSSHFGGRERKVFRCFAHRHSVFFGASILSSPSLPRCTKYPSTPNPRVHQYQPPATWPTWPPAHPWGRSQRYRGKETRSDPARHSRACSASFNPNPPLPMRSKEVLKMF